MLTKPIRLVLLVIATLALAALLFLQAASSIATRKQPKIATQLMPLNGLAMEQLAMQEFQSGVTQQADILPSAKKAAPIALDAFRRDPLTPKSLAIIALTQESAAKRQAILEKASALNRRDLLLQGISLEEKIALRDFSGALATLDNILRVHPEQSSTFFPILADALKDDEAAGQLGAILDRGSLWHENFLSYAAGKREALPNLAKLRLGRDNVDPQVDRQLIRGLVASGRTDLAFSIYTAAKTDGAGVSATAARKRLDWDSEYPPFDWSLSDEGGFRADYVPQEFQLEVYVRSGKGGVLVERLVRSPSQPFAIGVTHSLTPTTQVKDMRLQVGCPGAEKPLVDEPLSVRPGEIRVPAMSGRCEFMKIALYGRSWSGKSAIRGQIAPLTIRSTR